MKPCQLDKLQSHTQLFFLKMEKMILATTLSKVLNLFKEKHMCNPKQTQLILHNKDLSKPQDLFIQRYSLDKYKILPAEFQKQFSEAFPSEKTQAENEQSQLQYQRRFEAANQILRKQELERSQLIHQLN